MSGSLQEVDKFTNDEQFRIAKATIEDLVRAGELTECGLNPLEPTWFVEVYKAKNGDEWHLGNPDHAFRGFLRKIPQ